MDLIKKYKDEKCSKCNNRQRKLEEDLCDIKQFQYNGYVYCKCCNMTGVDKEIKQKVM